MAVVTPTITTDDPHVFREQMELIGSFANGVHIDYADGVFAPTDLLSIADSWRSDALITHIHVMYTNPLEHIDAIVTLGADLVVLHAESEDIAQALAELQSAGVRTGVALLPDTSVDALEPLAKEDLFDHVLIFAGRLGYQGSNADLSQLTKVAEIQKRYPDVEIGWDGGIDSKNVRRIADAGVAVLNVGGAIKHADDPKKAYEELVSLLS